MNSERTDQNIAVTEALRRHANCEKHNAHGEDVSESDATLAAAYNDGGFHWRHGMFFKRLTDGTVRVRHFTDWNYNPTYEDWLIPAPEWASIVCSVSKEGEANGRWLAAQHFHDGLANAPSINAELVEALESCASWISRWTKHVACISEDRCTCGRTAILFEARNALSRAQSASAEATREQVERLLSAAKLLYANAEGCVTNHHGLIDTAGIPWLADALKDIRAVEAALTPDQHKGDQ